MVGRSALAHTNASKYEVLSPSRQELDLMDFGAVVDFLRLNKPDFIVHAAGKVGGIKANIEDPYGFLIENVTLGSNIIRAAKECGIKKLLNLGSSCIYPRDGTAPLEENSILAGSLESTNEGYALSKIIAIRACEYITQQFDQFSYKTIIPCNLYGPFDKFDGNSAHLIPAIITKLHTAVRDGHKTVEIWGDGSARREFMFSGDLGGLIWEACSQFDNMPHIMNAGIGRDYSVKEYYEIAASVIGFEGGFEFDTSQPVGAAQKLTSSKNALAWGWSPNTDLRTGIAKTYEFYKGLNC